MSLLELKAGSLSCQIAPDLGGAICRFNHAADGHVQHLLRPTADTNSRDVTSFSSWPLVPFSNRINRGTFAFNGKDYRVPLVGLGAPMHVSHGHGAERPWLVARHTETICDMTFAFNDSALWPFPYKAEQNFALDEQGLSIRLSLVNAGKEAMPAGLGLHPYFPRTQGTTLRATVAHLWEIDKTTIPTRRVAVSQEYNFSEPKSLDNIVLDNCFDGYGGLAEITWPHEAFKLRMISSDNLRHLVVYVPQGGEFFCAEPVSHMPDAVNRSKDLDTGLVTLDPGQSITGTYRFEVIPI